jgi:hypothetical protein
MASDGLPVERLRQYLRQLPPGARALLTAELERAALRGDEIPGGDMLLAEVRSAVRESGGEAPRVDAAARRFLRPLDPFLFDGDPAKKYHGRIARASLEPIWAWICRDIVPIEAKTYREQVGGALASGDGAECDRLVHSFQDRVTVAIRAGLAAAQRDEKVRRRLVVQIGTPKALDDALDLANIIACRDAFALIESRLPGQIRNFTDAQIESAKSLLDSPIGLDRDMLPYALIVVMRRLAAPWQLIRLAVKAADSDAAAKIAGTPYAAAVTIALGEVEWMVEELKTDIQRGAGAAVSSLLKSIHDAARGLRTELDLAGDSPWSRQLAAMRSEIASVLKAQIESLPGRVRRLLRPRPASEIAAASALDPGDVAETEALIEIVGACRNYASELAINEMTLRTYHELQQYLDTGTSALLDGLRHAGDGDRPFRQSQVDAAVRFCGKVFGKEYASLLTKAAEVAANSERKAAARG